MVAPKVQENDHERVAELLGYDILDTPEEEEFNEIVALASQMCDMPISLISLIDEDRQWFKAKVGIDDHETPREEAFCAHAINGNDIFEVRNALEDERFADNPNVVGRMNIRFYAGVPLTTPAGFNLGTLCVIDDKPGRLSAEQERALKILANQVITHFELRKKNRKLKEVLMTVDLQNDELEKRNQMLTRLLSIISHDLRTPLENLRQLFEMFISGELSAKELNSLGNELSKGLSTTSDLLNNLLNWASRQLNGTEANITEVNVFELTKEQLAGVEAAAGVKNNKLENRVSHLSNIQADPDIVRFVIRNLVANANKFTSDGSITVELIEGEHTNAITVTDTGCGISPENMKRLFNWKNRQTTRGTSGEKGSGLGLLIVKQFAEQHGGQLLIESEVGVGTKVIFEMAKTPKAT